jgi:transposase
MKKIREVIRLKTTTGLSERQIARALGISRPVVAKYWAGFQASGLEAERIEAMADSALLRLLEPPAPTTDNAQYRQLAQYFPGYVVELTRTGVTLELLWQEYRRRHPEGYQYSRFCYHFQIWRGNSDVRMHIEHKAGEKLFVDYAGDKLALTDPTSGQQKPVEVFVAVLGASGLTYVEASESQAEEDWIRSNERALWYIGGVTEALVPDNLRAGVSHADRYEPGITPAFDDFARHYGTVILPARVRKARDKALVENAVRLVYQRIYAPLRDRTFATLEELNEAIGEQLEKHNTRPFQRLPISRRELFEQAERGALRPLPAERYPMRTTRWANVQFNYHVELREDLHYYSVPYYLYRKEPKTRVKMVYDERNVALYYDNVRIAQHRRDRRPNGYTTAEEHMPPAHRWYAQWSPERFLKWAAEIGEEVKTTIEAVLDSRKHPEQSFRVCLGILSLAKKYGARRLEQTCRKANELEVRSYRRIEAMLRLGAEADRQPQLELAPIPEHENIRGSGYYN